MPRHVAFITPAQNDPEQDRALSVREAARLQSFPDAFGFAGSRVQVGNAVPPVLARQVGRTILASGSGAGGDKPRPYETAGVC